MAALPGVVGAKVDVKRGDVEVLSVDKRTGEKSIRKTIRNAKFKVVSINGPFKVKR